MTTETQTTEQNDFEHILNLLKEQVDLSIRTALKKFVPVFPDAHLHEAMEYAAVGNGKRLRAFLVFACAGACGEDFSPEAVLQTAGAIECLHAYSLVHDDLPAMDNDDYRRGRLTVHREFDEATAILTGDALQTLAFQMLTDSELITDFALQAELVRILATASGGGGMVLGQHLDLLSEKVPADVQTFEQVRRIQQCKTGALITAACQMGAAVGHASSDHRKALHIYGDSIGLAFQIKDDLLDITSTREILGKDTHKDQERGKATFVSLEGEQATTTRLNQLVNIACEAVKDLPQASLLQECALFIQYRTF